MLKINKKGFLNFLDNYSQTFVTENADDVFYEKINLTRINLTRITVSSYLLGAKVGANVTMENYARINTLKKYDLTESIPVNVENEDGIVTVSIPDPPLYGEGDDIHEALDMLKDEIEDLYEDLNEDDNFADIWLSRRDYLNSIIIPKNA